MIAGFTPLSDIQFSKKQKFIPRSLVQVIGVQIVGSLRDQKLACSVSDNRGSNLDTCFWRVVSFHFSHHPQIVLLAQFNLYVRKCGLNLHSFLPSFLPSPSFLHSFIHLLVCSVILGYFGRWFSYA